MLTDLNVTRWRQQYGGSQSENAGYFKLNVERDELFRKPTANKS